MNFCLFISRFAIFLNPLASTLCNRRAVVGQKRVKFSPGVYQMPRIQIDMGEHLYCTYEEVYHDGTDKLLIPSFQL